MLHRNVMTATARAGFWACLTGAVVMAVLPQPPHTPLDGFGDKFEHMVAFAVLTLLAAYGFPAMPRLRIAERLSFLGALIEVVQSIPALHRDCDVRDWVVDTAVIVAVLALLRALRLPRAVKPSPFA